MSGRAQRNSVNVISGRLFPFHFLFLGGTFLLAGLGFMTSNPIIATLLMLSGILILTAYEGTEISPGSRTYRAYYSFLFLKKGKRKKYGSIEKIFVNSGEVTQKVYTAHTMTSATFSRMEYNAWLKFKDGEKLFLASARNKEKLLKRLNEIAGKLNTSVVDSTT